MTNRPGGPPNGAKHTYIGPRKRTGVETFGEPYEPIYVRSTHPLGVPGMVVKSSCRWFRNLPASRREEIVIPYVMNTGKFSVHALATWRCFPEQAIASVTATVYQRLLKLFQKRKRNLRDTRQQDRNFILKIAVVYTITHSDYFLDRMLALLGRSKAVKGVFRYFLCRLGDKLWFVYRQVCLHTYWLTNRSLGTRDKPRMSTTKVSQLPDLGYWVTEMDDDRLTPFYSPAMFYEQCLDYRSVPFKTSAIAPRVLRRRGSASTWSESETSIFSVLLGYHAPHSIDEWETE